MTARRIALTINGRPVTAEVEPQMLLVEFLRERQNLRGTHVGCDTSQCGCCVVHVNGKSIKSCTLLAVAADGCEVTTVEGLGGEAAQHPLQIAFAAKHALQCGYCTPGVLMGAAELLEHNPDPSEDEIRHWIEGNLCRCTGYHNIVAAVREAARIKRAGG
jgi:carbon-monoxide dehydrogenase small subunit